MLKSLLPFPIRYLRRQLLTGITLYVTFVLSTSQDILCRLVVQALRLRLTNRNLVEENTTGEDGRKGIGCLGALNEIVGVIV